MSSAPVRTTRSAVRRVVAVAAGAVSVACAVLGHPGTVPGPGTAGMSRGRCHRACGGRCRSAVRSRPVLL